MSYTTCHVRYVLMDETRDEHVVTLQEIDGDRRLVISIGPMEAASIDRGLHHDAFNRPLTHDLCNNIITQLGGDLTCIRIVKEEQHTYFAELVIDQGEQQILVDCRPSDALAIHSRLKNIPIDVADRLLSNDD